MTTYDTAVGQCIYITCFFFQAEDGIRDVAVTGVQTCALPIAWNVLRSEGKPSLLARYRPPHLRNNSPTYRCSSSDPQSLRMRRGFSIWRPFPVARESRHPSWLSRAHRCWSWHCRRSPELASFRTALLPWKLPKLYRVLFLRLSGIPDKSYLEHSRLRFGETPTPERPRPTQQERRQIGFREFP